MRSRDLRLLSVNTTIRLTVLLGWQDVLQAYRRSVVGPFWLTFGMAAQIAIMGTVFGLIFKTELEDFLPFLTIGIIVWGFISSTMNEGCFSFIAGESVIKQLNIPLIVHPLRVLWRNLVIFGHNILILPLVFLIFLKQPDWIALLAIPGLIILLGNLGWIIVVLGLLSARYRDMPPIVNSLATVAFYLTPIMWYPKLIGNNELAHILLGFNPFYHLVQIIRLPLLGEAPTMENWMISICMLLLGVLGSRLVFLKNRHKIAFWV